MEVLGGWYRRIPPKLGLLATLGCLWGRHTPHQGGSPEGQFRHRWDREDQHLLGLHLPH
jgi:hypothetical protein